MQIISPLLHSLEEGTMPQSRPTPRSLGGPERRFDGLSGGLGLGIAASI